MSKGVFWTKRWLVYLAGLLITAFGVSLSKRSELGVSPVNAIPSVLSEITGMDMGIWTTLVFTGFILIQILILRREFKAMQLLQIIGSVVFGYFVSVTSSFVLAAVPPCVNYPMQLLYSLISIVFVAVGILLYLQAGILSLPAEGVMQALSLKTGARVSTIKIFFDCTVILIAGGISYLALGRLAGVREGTILAALGVGLCMKLLMKLIGTPLVRFLFGAGEHGAAGASNL